MFDIRNVNLSVRVKPWRANDPAGLSDFAQQQVDTAILDGRQQRHLNLHAMRGRQREVPLDWEEQRGMFGIASIAI